jgi:hypothetical protein
LTLGGQFKPVAIQLLLLMMDVAVLQTSNPADADPEIPFFLLAIFQYPNQLQ